MYLSCSVLYESSFPLPAVIRERLSVLILRRGSRLPISSMVPPLIAAGDSSSPPHVVTSRAHLFPPPDCAPCPPEFPCARRSRYVISGPRSDIQVCLFLSSKSYPTELFSPDSSFFEFLGPRSVRRIRTEVRRHFPLTLGSSPRTSSRTPPYVATI